MSTALGKAAAELQEHAAALELTARLYREALGAQRRAEDAHARAVHALVEEFGQGMGGAPDAIVLKVAECEDGYAAAELLMSIPVDDLALAVLDEQASALEGCAVSVRELAHEVLRHAGGEVPRG